MRRALVIAALLGSLFVGGASATEVTIVPNVSIGKVRLGMTLRQVKKALGPPQVVNARAQLSGKRGYVEYGWNFSTFWVGFVNTKGVLHAALIGTDIVGEKTRDGVGVHTPLAKLRARYRVACNDYPHGKLEYNKWYTDPGEIVYTYCVLGPATAPTTVFGLRCTGRYKPAPIGCTAWAVERVIVRTSF